MSASRLRGRLGPRRQELPVPVPRQPVLARRRATERPEPARHGPSRRSRWSTAACASCGRCSRPTCRARTRDPQGDRVHPRAHGARRWRSVGDRGRAVVRVRVRLGARVPAAARDDHRRRARRVLQPVVDRCVGLGRVRPGSVRARLARARAASSRRLGDGDRRGAAPAADRIVRRVQEAARADLVARHRADGAAARVGGDRLRVALGSGGLLGEPRRDRHRGGDAGRRRADPRARDRRQRLRQPDADSVLRAAHHRAARAVHAAHGRARVARATPRRDAACRARVSPEEPRWPGQSLRNVIAMAATFAALARVHREPARRGSRGARRSVGGLRRAAALVFPLALRAAHPRRLVGEGRGDDRAGDRRGLPRRDADPRSRHRPRRARASRCSARSSACSR